MEEVVVMSTMIGHWTLKFDSTFFV